jgi:hypothetical protein
MRKRAPRFKETVATSGPLSPDDSLLTPDQTAKALKISPRTLAYWTAGRRPRLPYIKIGKSKRFIAGDVIRFIEGHRIAV